MWILQPEFLIYSDTYLRCPQPSAFWTEASLTSRGYLCLFFRDYPGTCICTRSLGTQNTEAQREDWIFCQCPGYSWLTQTALPLVTTVSMIVLPLFYKAYNAYSPKLVETLISDLPTHKQNVWPNTHCHREGAGYLKYARSWVLCQITDYFW